MATYYRYDEFRRLREMGIDPDGDPIEIMQEVKRRRQAYLAQEEEAAKAERPAEESEKKIVDEAEEPR